MDLIVDMEGIFEPSTGGINWTFKCLDPVTLKTPEDTMAGFLPPITENGTEIGWLSFSVDPVEGLTSGTQVENQAFGNPDDVGGFNPAPPGGTWVNTIDAAAPNSSMTAELLDGATIQLNWTWQDVFAFDHNCLCVGCFRGRIWAHICILQHSEKNLFH